MLLSDHMKLLGRFSRRESPLCQTTSLGVRCGILLLSVFFATAILTPSLSYARDMQGRFGLGYNAEWASSYAPGGVPAVSIKYGLTRDIATELAVGVATSSPTNEVTGLKFFKNIFFETNLNFYFMIGGGILAAEDSAGNKTTGAEFLGGFGAEFFIPGLESLGLAFETGASFDNLSGSFILKTLGVSFLNAGIHFYF